VAGHWFQVGFPVPIGLHLRHHPGGPLLGGLHQIRPDGNLGRVVTGNLFHLGVRGLALVQKLPELHRSQGGVGWGERWCEGGDRRVQRDAPGVTIKEGAFRVGHGVSWVTCQEFLDSFANDRPVRFADDFVTFQKAPLESEGTAWWPGLATCRVEGTTCPSGEAICQVEEASCRDDKAICQIEQTSCQGDKTTCQEHEATLQGRKAICRTGSMICPAPTRLRCPSVAARLHGLSTLAEIEAAIEALPASDVERTCCLPRSAAVDETRLACSAAHGGTGGAGADRGGDRSGVSDGAGLNHVAGHQRHLRVGQG